MDTESKVMKAATPVDETIIGPSVTLVVGGNLLRADGTKEVDKGTFSIGAGDRIEHTGKTGVVIVDKADGGILEVYPGGDIFCEPYLTSGDFDFLVDAGKGRIMHASATIAGRKKVLRSPGTTTAALGTVYSWEKTPENFVVICEQGYVDIDNPLQSWSVTVNAAKMITFTDSDRVAPLPVDV